MYQFESGTNNIKISFLERPDGFVRCYPTQTIQQQTQSYILYFLLHFLGLVPRRSLLLSCLRVVWEREGERTRSQQVSLGDFTAPGRVQD